MGGQLQVAMFDKTVSNPQVHIARAIAMFTRVAPDVALQLHVGTMTAIERGVLDGQYQIGIIPGHRSSDALEYAELFDEIMLLYAGADHPLMGANPQTLDWDSLRAYPFAGLGYHSPNMEISQQVRLTRKATGFDQEAIATLILSGQFLGFLPDHYAQSFVDAGKMRAIQPALFRYACQFFAITRRSPQPARAARAFQDCLAKAHAAR